MIRGNLTLARPGFTLQAQLEFPERGVTALFGPSGCGKTTLLRTIAGLEPGATGRLEVGGALWQDSAAKRHLPPHRRPLGYVFQDAQLFPHLDVRRNLLFGYSRLPAAERRLEPEQVIDWLGLAALLDRSPGALSGGQRQRVAVGRALLTSPQLLLLDEPLSALDEAAKQEILPYLERLHQRLAFPMLYVSHDLGEVMRLADRIALMENGRILATGEVNEILTHHELSPVPSDYAGVVLTGRVVTGSTDHQPARVETEAGVIHIAQLTAQDTAEVRLRVMARDVSLALQPHHDTSILNILPATVLEVGKTEHGQCTIHLACGDATLLARITPYSCERLAVTAGKTLYAQIKAVAVLG
ncbi:MAG: molybdenum ABC transporter ATP-binding protein [Gammaproteobacteria bacterium]